MRLYPSVIFQAGIFISEVEPDSVCNPDPMTRWVKTLLARPVNIVLIQNAHYFSGWPPPLTKLFVSLYVYCRFLYSPPQDYWEGVAGCRKFQKSEVRNGPFLSKNTHTNTNTKLEPNLSRFTLQATKLSTGNTANGFFRSTRPAVETREHCLWIIS